LTDPADRENQYIGVSRDHPGLALTGPPMAVHACGRRGFAGRGEPGGPPAARHPSSAPRGVPGGAPHCPVPRSSPRGVPGGLCVATRYPAAAPEGYRVGLCVATRYPRSSPRTPQVPGGPRIAARHPAQAPTTRCRMGPRPPGAYTVKSHQPPSRQHKIARDFRALSPPADPAHPAWDTTGHADSGR
jgi:hypothetical protein